MKLLTKDEILSTGAYKRRCRVPNANDACRRANGARVRKNYTAWYDPAFEFCRTEINGIPYQREHMDPQDRRLRGEIERLQQNIASRGLRNPVLICCRNRVWTLHPGKCRAKALENLGIRTIPAVFVDFRPNAPVPQGMVEIRSKEQLLELFEGDLAPEMTHRGIRTPKLR